jgi:hypothetical protein
MKEIKNISINCISGLILFIAGVSLIADGAIGIKTHYEYCNKLRKENTEIYEKYYNLKKIYDKSFLTVIIIRAEYCNDNTDSSLFTINLKSDLFDKDWQFKAESKSLYTGEILKLVK